MAADKLGELAILVEAVGVDKAIGSLKKAQKQMEEGEKKANANAKALSEFATKFGGAMAIVTAGISATAFALLSQMPILQELFSGLSFMIQELAYLMDEVLRPAMQPIVDAIYNLADSFSGLPPWLQATITWSVIVIAVLAGLLAVIIPLVIAFAVAGEAMLIVVGILVGLAQVLIPLILIIALLYYAWTDNWLGIRDIVLGVVATIEGIITAFQDWFQKNFGDDIAEIMKEAGKTFDFWSKNVKSVIDAVTSIIRLGLGVIKKLWDDDFGGIRTKVEVTFKIITEVIKAAWDIIKTIFETYGTFVMNNIKIILALLRGDWGAAWGYAKDTMKTMVDAMISIIDTLGAALKGIANIIIDVFNDAIDSINELDISIPDWVPVYGGKSWSPEIPKIPSLRTEGIIKKSGVAEVHAGEAVFTLQTMQDAFINAMKLSGMDRGREVNIYLDGRKLNRALSDRDGTDLAARGGMY
jgi:phage-related protein